MGHSNHYDVLQIGSGIIGSCTAFELTSRGLSVSVVDLADSYGCETTSRSNLFTFQSNHRGLGGNLSTWSGLCGVVSEHEWNEYKSRYNLSISYQELIALYDRASYFGFPSFQTLSSPSQHLRNFLKVRVSQDILNCAKSKCRFIVAPIKSIVFSQGYWTLTFEDLSTITSKVLHIAAGGLSNLSILNAICPELINVDPDQMRISLHRKQIVDETFLSVNFPEILDKMKFDPTFSDRTVYKGYCSSDFSNLFYSLIRDTRLTARALNIKQMIPDLPSRFSILSPSIIIQICRLLPPSFFNPLRVCFGLFELFFCKLSSVLKLEKLVCRLTSRNFYYHHNTYLHKISLSKKSSAIFPFSSLHLGSLPAKDPYHKYIDSNHFCSSLFLNVLSPKRDILNGILCRKSNLFCSGTSNLPSALSIHPTFTALALSLSTCDAIVKALSP